MTNPILKAHLEGVDKIEIFIRGARCDKHDQDGTLMLSQTCPNCIAVKNAYLECQSFLTTYGINLLKAAQEAGPGEKDNYFETPARIPKEWSERGQKHGWNDCRSSFISAIDKGIKGIKKGKK